MISQKGKENKEIIQKIMFYFFGDGHLKFYLTSLCHSLVLLIHYSAFIKA